MNRDMAFLTLEVLFIVGDMEGSTSTASFLLPVNESLLDVSCFEECESS